MYDTMETVQHKVHEDGAELLAEFEMTLVQFHTRVITLLK